MNAEKIEIEKEEVLKIVNEDWPMLEELGKKRFVLNKKKNKNVQESLNLLQAVLEEDSNLSEGKDNIVEAVQPISIPVSVVNIPIVQTVKNENVVIKEESSFVQAQNLISSTSQLVENKQATEVVVQQETQSVIIQKPTFLKNVKETKLVEEKSMDLFKLIIAGLTHLYVSKTSKLLKPMKFVVDNYKEVSIAALHFIVPLIMTYLITTQIGFVHEQLIRETNLMKPIYFGVFFFGSTFVWISGQVLLSGIYSMLKKSMLEVAKVGKENK